MIEVEDEGGVRCLRLNHPPSNSLTPAMLARISSAVAEAGRSRSIRVILLSSRLPKYFSSGLDLDEVFRPPPERRAEVFLQLLETHRELAAFPGPSLAALNGYAMLGGWILAMACDFRWMAEENGRFALSEIRFGLSPTEFLLRRLRAMEADPLLVKDLVLRGKTLKAVDALRGRFVDRLLPESVLDEESRREAGRLAKLPPEAYASIKRALAASAGADDADMFARSRCEFGRLLAGEEAQEGLAAMREKRRARWE